VAALASAVREDGVRIHSPNAIADALGVDRGTVLADEAELVSAHKLEPAEKVLGKDGKVRPSKRPTIVSAKDERAAERAQQALSAVRDTPEGARTVRDIGRQLHARAKPRPGRHRERGTNTHPGQTCCYHMCYHWIMPSDPAKILLRVPKGLHEHLRDTADAEGVSVNALLIALLAGASGWKRESRAAT